MGTRGSFPNKLGKFWFEGPKWLSCRDQWLVQPEVCQTKEAAEEKIAHVAIAMTVVDQDQSQNEEMLRKYDYGKLLRITVYMIRFKKNAKGENLSGCLKTEEIVNAERLWLRHVQKHVATISNIDLMENGVGILRVGSRIPDYRPIFVPKGCILDRTLVRHLHEQIVNHGQSKRTVLDTTIKSVSEKRYPRLQQMSPIQSTTSTPTTNGTIASV